MPAETSAPVPAESAADLPSPEEAPAETRSAETQPDAEETDKDLELGRALAAVVHETLDRAEADPVRVEAAEPADDPRPAASLEEALANATPPATERSE
ncbi:MAG: hypothetical protein GXP55_08130 [Deltaproteobacteria bacterium]|nr:hypothetical protein [Deltaproteobacteria bacterium]